MLRCKHGGGFVDQSRAEYVVRNIGRTTRIEDLRSLVVTMRDGQLGALAIAIGELVDDAVVDAENVFRRLKENREAGSPRPVLEVVADASREVRSGIIYATIIVILVFLRLFALQGIEGKLCRRASRCCR